jgi:hypothetical protein
MRDIFNSSDLNGARQKAAEISRQFSKIAPEF